MRYKKEIDFRDRKLVFVDLETTGLNIDRHEIIEVAALVVNGRNFEIEKEYEVKVKPKNLKTASSSALKITGYRDEDWKNAKDLKEVLVEFSKLAPHGMLVGWNVAFDWVFLERGFIKHKIEHKYDHHKIDVIPILYAKHYKNKKLTSLGLRRTAPFFGVELPERHGAMVDIRATYEIFKKLMQEK